MTDQPDAPFDLERVTLVLLVRPPDAPELDEAEADALQAAHLAHLDRLRREGKLLAAGPLIDQPDERLRGICLLRVEPSEARDLLSRDPAVRRGRLAPEVMSWFTRAGELRFGASPGPPDSAPLR
jgi:uncharacterized protein YciI